jgi:hypothetical protein
MALPMNITRGKRESSLNASFYNSRESKDIIQSWQINISTVTLNNT